MIYNEYTADTYPCSGKMYNGEKAIISLTSWKARINTVSTTLLNLNKTCPNFHIVLVLSEEEFPNKENELPENLLKLIKNNLVEILWVYKNYKSFKKVLFTMDKYKTVPVISADDDCIYTCNYAQELYDTWTNYKTHIITYGVHVQAGFQWCCGPSTLYFPNAFADFALNNIVKQFKNNNIDVFNNNNDDAYICACITALKLKICSINKNLFSFCKFHDEIMPCSAHGYNAVKNILDYLAVLK